MMRSLDRGLGRGADPKRSRSARGPPVCMSSMAQHASPKSRYQTLFDRPQLRSQLTIWSTRVLMTLAPSSLYRSSRPVAAFVAIVHPSCVTGRALTATAGVAIGGGKAGAVLLTTLGTPLGSPLIERIHSRSPFTQT